MTPLWNALRFLLPHTRTGDSQADPALEAYRDGANGDGNDDPTTNGERWIVTRLSPQLDVVFDVGANRGDWAAMLLAAKPGVALYCFEPYPPTFRELSNRGFPSNVRCNAAGLSASCHTASLFVFDGQPALNSLYCRRGLEDGWRLASPQRQETVELISLDHYCSLHAVPSIDYLKLDVEGHELEVLTGGRRLFERGLVKFGQFEYGGCNIDSRVLLHDFFQWFEQVGYKLFKLFPDRLLPVARYDQRFENFKYQNWVFARADLSVPA
jgi:FkbM family methyltransferase